MPCRRVGATTGEQAIQLAYQQAEKAMLKMVSIGFCWQPMVTFNVGITDFSTLKGMVAENAKVVFHHDTGFGTGNYNEQLMEQLADAGRW